MALKASGAVGGLMRLHHVEVSKAFCSWENFVGVGFISLVPPKGHQVYTLTNIEKGTLYTLTKNRNINTASLWPEGLGFKALSFAWGLAAWGFLNQRSAAT